MELNSQPSAIDNPIHQTAINVATLAREIFMRQVSFGIAATDIETVVKKSYKAASMFDSYTVNFLSVVTERTMKVPQDEVSN